MKVYQAINAVQRALSKEGIVKERMASGFGAGYAFRGIDDVYNTLSPLLSNYGLVIIPRCVERHETQRASGAKTLYFVVVKMEFDFVSSKDGSKHTACMYGEAMDSGDKATNKAMSIAYKYACFQAFAIPTEADNDPDATVHEPAPNAQQRPNNSKPNNQPANKPKQQQQAGAGQQQQQQLAHPNKVIADIRVAATLDTLNKIEAYVDTHAYPPDAFETLKDHIYKRSCELKAEARH